MQYSTCIDIYIVTKNKSSVGQLLQRNICTCKSTCTEWSRYINYTEVKQMIIQHNMTAANANRQLGQVVSKQAKSTEKLSSGYRINRAADDAAGLSISEKMRGQIRGLNQASTNAQDGISLIQTAEGALNETHSILQRMRELSVQSANGTATDEDRQSIQAEIDQLQDEVNRISETTEFNTMKLLDGSFSTSLQIGANSGQTMKVSVNAMDTASLGLSSGAVLSSKVDAKGLSEGTYRLDGTELKDKNGNTVGTYDNATSKITLSAKEANGDAKVIELGHRLTDGSTLTVKGSEAEVKVTNLDTIPDTTTSTKEDAAAGGQAVDPGDVFTVNEDGTITTSSADYTVEETENGIKVTNKADGTKFTEFTFDKDLSLNAGDTFSIDGADGVTVTRATSTAKQADGIAAGNYKVSGNNLLLGDKLVGTIGKNSTKLTLADGSEYDLAKAGLAKGDLTDGATFTVKGIDVSTADGASASLDTLDSAIASVSKQRSSLGAIQNRLEHTISNLDNTSENLQTAESSIRDVDMASEMMNYTKNNILQQAAQSMLAQANQSTQGVLSLLG